MGDREGPGTGKGKKAQEPSRAMLAEAQPDEAVSATVRGSHAEGQRRVKLKARFECPVSDKGKGPARVEHPRDFAPTQPKKVLDAGQALPSGRTSKSRAVHGVSPAEEDALACKSVNCRFPPTGPAGHSPVLVRRFRYPPDDWASEHVFA